MMCGIQTGGRGEASYIAQQTCNSIATVWAMKAGRKNERTIDSCTNDYVKQYLVKAKSKAVPRSLVR